MNTIVAALCLALCVLAPAHAATYTYYVKNALKDTTHPYFGIGT